METKLKDLKSFETQEEYKSDLVHRAFVREQIALSKDRILGLTNLVLMKILRLYSTTAQVILMQN